MKVFVLWHTHDLPGGGEDSKLIGVYSTKDSAEAAKGRVLRLPGFSDVPDGCTIDGYELDQDQWREGYVTVIKP